MQDIRWAASWSASCFVEGMRENEPELIAAGKSGDRTAITELFEQHYPSSLRVARRLLRSEQEAQDAVQSAYLAAFRHLPSFRGDAAFKTWITRIVTNECFMLMRRSDFRTQSVNLEIVARTPSTAPNPEKSALSQEIAAAVSEAAAKLPKLLLEVFQLYTFGGLTLRQVSAATGLTMPAVKTRLYRAQVRMREQLQPVRPNALRTASRHNRAARPMQLEEAA